MITKISKKLGYQVFSLLYYGKLDKRKYESIKPDLQKGNHKIWRFLSLFIFVFFACILVTSFYIDNPLSHQYYQIAGIVGMVLALPLFTFIRAESRLLLPTIYLVSTFCIAFSIHLTMVTYTNSLTVSYFILLLGMALSILDKPFRLIAYDVVFLFIFILFAMHYKQADILVLDILNDIIFTIVATIIHIIISIYRFESMYLKHAQKKATNEVARIKRTSRRKISILSSLAADFVNIVYFDLDKNQALDYYNNATETRSTDEILKLSYDEHINLFVDNMICAEDQKYVRSHLQREKVIEALKEKPVIFLRYRVAEHGELVYYETKIIRDMEYPDQNIVIGAMHNINEEMQRELHIREKLQQTRILANSDALTGVKNKTAFTTKKRKMDAKIAIEPEIKFALVMCDVNNLKITNDTQGHEAGDTLLQTICAAICDVYKHSPVYRIGGDEFVILLMGNDYENRHELFKSIQHISAGDKENLSFAVGMAEYEPFHDISMQDVFSRADAAMYQNKKSMKQTI